MAFFVETARSNRRSVRTEVKASASQFFGRVADRLGEKPTPSLRSLAAEAEPTHYHFMSSIQRVEAHLGAKLIHTNEKISSANGLTPEGLRYSEELRRVVEWRPAARQVIRLAVSHSLLTSRSLTSALAAFQERHGCQIDLHARVEMNSSAIIRDLQTSQLDAAVLWSARPVEEHFPGIETHQFHGLFDMILVSGDPRALEDLKKDPDLLQRRRVATLRSGLQPAIVPLPQPDRGQGGERIEMDTIGAVIACVMARVADFGLVVANYDVLEPLRLAGCIFFMDPADDDKHKAPLLGLSTKTSGELTRDLIQFLDKSLAASPNQPRRALRPENSTFPDDPRFYQGLKFDYYIDEPRGPEPESGRLAPAWRWEDVKLEIDPKKKDHRSFTGSVHNSHKANFRCEAQLIGGNLFYVKATQAEFAVQPAAVVEFVSVFTWRERDEGFLFGHWVGREPIDNSPAIYSSIWSREWLPFDRLRQIAHQVRIRTMWNAEEGIDFERHPGP